MIKLSYSWRWDLTLFHLGKSCDIDLDSVLQRILQNCTIIVPSLLTKARSVFRNPRYRYLYRGEDIFV